MQNLTALVGKAFQVAFAESKFPKGAELKMEPLLHTSSDERVVQGRRWVGIILFPSHHPQLPVSYENFTTETHTKKFMFFMLAH